MKILSKLLSRVLGLVLVLRAYPHMHAQTKRLNDSLTFHWKHLDSGVDTGLLLLRDAVRLEPASAVV